MANQQFIAHDHFFQQDMFFPASVEAGDGNGKVGFVVSFKGEGFVGLSLVPFAHQKEENEPGQRVGITRSPAREHLPSGNPEKDQDAQGDGQVDAGAFLFQVLPG